MDENIIAIAHVETEVEADCAVAALADAGINAVKEAKNTSGGSTLLAMPTAMGFGASEGYDIVVNAAVKNKAAQVLAGIGVVELDEDDIQEEPAEKQETEPETAEPPKASVLSIILFLAALALFVIGVDKVIELIKSLFY